MTKPRVLNNASTEVEAIDMGGDSQQALEVAGMVPSGDELPRRLRG